MSQAHVESRGEALEGTYDPVTERASVRALVQHFEGMELLITDIDRNITYTLPISNYYDHFNIDNKLLERALERVYAGYSVLVDERSGKVGKPKVQKVDLLAEHIKEELNKESDFIEDLPRLFIELDNQVKGMVNHGQV